MAYCANCGQKLDDGAHFCSNCGMETGNIRIRTVPEGERRTCPYCGEIIESFTSICPSCGHELRGIKVNCSIQQFYSDLSNATTTEEKTTLIRSFPIPNTKEDVLEFMIMVASNINVDLLFSDDSHTKALAEAWLAKFEQIYQKASLLFRVDPDFIKIQVQYENCKQNIDKEISKRKHKRRINYIFRNAAACVGMIVLIIAIIYYRLGGNASFIELTGYIILIASAVSLERKTSTIVDFAIGILSGVFTIIVSFILDNGSMAILAGGLIFIIVAAMFFRKISRK